MKPTDLKVIIENLAIKNIKAKTAINGTFFWLGKPNGILISGGKVLCNDASHAWEGYPQSTIYCTLKGEVKIARIMSANEILGEGIDWAIGGVGIVTPYGYSPASEGFKGKYADVLREANKTFMGYKKNENSISICIRPDSSHSRIIQSCNSLGLDFAISLDGGGSSSIKVNNKVLLSGDGRAVNNYITTK